MRTMQICPVSSAAGAFGSGHSCHTRMQPYLNPRGFRYDRPSPQSFLSDSLFTLWWTWVIVTSDGINLSLQLNHANNFFRITQKISNDFQMIDLHYRAGSIERGYLHMKKNKKIGKGEWGFHLPCPLWVVVNQLHRWSGQGYHTPASDHQKDEEQ
jgi:hypothetical protein